jgi:septum formation protein
MKPAQDAPLASGQPLILASSSPRRQELLGGAGIPFEARPPHTSEDRIAGEPALEYAYRVAREKAQAVARECPNRYVLGADTIVTVENEILGKPRDAEDARRMLRLLSNRGHEVTTAVCLLLPSGGVNNRHSTTRVTFRKIEEEEIRAYVASGEPMDKAGAYAIQGGAQRWTQAIDGEYSNVVGLPLSLVTEMLCAGGFMD